MNSIKLTMFAMLLTVSTVSLASDRPNYSKGFCVKEGRNLIKENTFVSLNGNVLDGVSYLPMSHDHNFFDENGSDVLILDFVLVRESRNNPNDQSFSAAYVNYLQGYDVPFEKVICVVSPQLQNFQ